MRAATPTFRRIPLFSVGLFALTLVPILAAVVHAVRAGWVPIGDHGLIELRAADVLTTNHPWLGTWTSASLTAPDHMNNPGPLLFDALAPFIKWFGGSVGAVIGVATINAAACAATLWQGHVLGGRRGQLLMAAACVLLSWSMGSEMLIDPWQPHVLLLPALALLAAAGASSAGHVRSVPWMVALASLLVQSHLSFAYLVAIVGAAALFMCWRSIRSAAVAGSPLQWRRSAVVASVVALACWLQPLYEQFFGTGTGNLSRLAKASGGSSDTIGLVLGVRLVSRIVALPPWFLRPSFQESIPSTPRSEDGSLDVAIWPSFAVALFALVAVFAVAVLLIRRLRASGDVALASLLTIAVVAVGGAVFTMLLVPVGALGLAPHHMRWLWPISVLLWCTLAAAAVRLAPEHWPLAGHRRQVVLAALTVVALLSVPTLLTDSGPAADRQYRAVVSSMIDQLEHVQLDGPAVFDTTNLRFAEPFSGPALFVLLDGEQPVRLADEGFVRQVGDGRRAHGDEKWTVQVLEREAALEIDPGAQVLAYADGLTGAERTELFSLQESGDDAARLDELLARRQAVVVAIVLIPREPAPAAD